MDHLEQVLELLLRSDRPGAGQRDPVRGIGRRPRLRQTSGAAKRGGRQRLCWASPSGAPEQNAKLSLLLADCAPRILLRPRSALRWAHAKLVQISARSSVSRLRRWRLRASARLHPTYAVVGQRQSETAWRSRQRQTKRSPAPSWPAPNPCGDRSRMCSLCTKAARHGRLWMWSGITPRFAPRSWDARLGARRAV